MVVQSFLAQCFANGAAAELERFFFILSGDVGGVDKYVTCLSFSIPEYGFMFFCCVAGTSVFFALCTRIAPRVKSKSL